MNYLFNQFDIYHHLNFASLTTILYITQKYQQPHWFKIIKKMMIHKITIPQYILNYSLAIQLYQCSSVQLLIQHNYCLPCFCNSYQDFHFQFVLLQRQYLMEFQFGGHQLSQEELPTESLDYCGSYHKIFCFNFYLDFNLSGLTIGISFALQLVGIFLGMAIGSLNIQDAYGEFKQQFLDNPQATSIKQQILFHIYYGLLPFLSLIRVSHEIVFHKLFNNPFDLLYFALIQFFQTRIMTYNDENCLKSNWGIKSLKLAKSPMYYLLIYQCIISLNRVDSFDFNNIKNIALCDFMIFVVSNGAVGLSSILVQKYLQEQK